MTIRASNPAVVDWAAARGEKWRAHISEMESTLQPVNEPLIGALRLDGPARIADVGCGGGTTSIEALRRAPAGSVVHGFDIAPGLVEVARARAAGEERLVFDLADVSTFLPERPYDRLVSRLGVMFFDDPAAAFANLARWLAPGGHFAFAVWGPPADNRWVDDVRAIVARQVEIPQAEADAPGPFRYADAKGLLALLDRAGFGGLDVQTWRGTLPIGEGLGDADAARSALSSFSSFGELLARAGGDAFEQAHRALTKHLAAHRRDGAIRMDASVHIVTGERRG